MTIGLLVVNAIKPGDRLPNEPKAQLEAKYQADATKRQETTATERTRPVAAVNDMVPDNFFGSASSNRNMLQIVFFSLLAGIALTGARRETTAGH